MVAFSSIEKSNRKNRDGTPGLPFAMSRRSGQRIQRAGRAARRHLEHMGVNHGGGDIAVAQQFLHRANVVTRLKQVSGK